MELPIIWGLTDRGTSKGKGCGVQAHTGRLPPQLFTKRVSGLGSALGVAARHCTPCSVVNVSVQSSLKRGLAEGFTSSALRNGKLEDIHVNTDWLQ